jgi:hypothetical protein
MLILRRTVPVIIAFVLGITAILLYFIPHQAAQDLNETLAIWDRIIAAFAYFLGMYSLLYLHGQRMKRRQAGWGYSVFVYLGFLVMTGAAAYNQGHWFLVAQVPGGAYDWLFQYVFIPSESTMFAMLAFFIASAAYRTFRARTTEAVILLVAAIIVMLGRVPIGALIWGQIPALQEWVMSVPNMAAKRGILLGVYLGAVATALRIIFGIERAYLGGSEK